MALKLVSGAAAAVGGLQMITKLDELRCDFSEQKTHTYPQRIKFVAKEENPLWIPITSGRPGNLLADGQAGILDGSNCSSDRCIIYNCCPEDPHPPQPRDNVLAVVSGTGSLKYRSGGVSTFCEGPGWIQMSFDEAKHPRTVKGLQIKINDVDGGAMVKIFSSSGNELASYGINPPNDDCSGPVKLFHRDVIHVLEFENDDIAKLRIDFDGQGSIDWISITTD